MKTTLRSLLLAFSFWIVIGVAHAQNGSIGIGTLAPNPSAALDISSTTKGLLYPRMTGVERRAIVSPALGLTVFQTGPDSVGQWSYNGSRWIMTGTTQNLNLSGNQLSISGGNTVTLPTTGADNGLTNSAGSIKLGGVLSENTVLNTSDKNFSFQTPNNTAPTNFTIGSGAVFRTVLFNASFGTNLGSAARIPYTHSTANGGDVLNGIIIRSSGTYATGPLTLEVYNGSTLLGTQTFTMGGGSDFRTVTLPTPVVLVSGQLYSLRLTTATTFLEIVAVSPTGAGIGPMTFDNGSAISGTPFVPEMQLILASPPFTPRLAIGSTGVGIGTLTPSSALDVECPTRLRGLTGTGTRKFTTDASGNHSTAAIPAGADNMGNHTATTNLNLNNFRINNGGTNGLRMSAGNGISVNTNNSGSGSSDWIGLDIGATSGPRVVGGLLFGRPTIGGHAAGLSGWNELLINPYGGSVGIGVDVPSTAFDVGGTVRLRNLTGTGSRMVVAGADGSLSTEAIPSTTVTGANGVSASGATVSLGGALTQGTNIALGANSLSFTDAIPTNASFAIGQVWNGPAANFNHFMNNIGSAIRVGYTHNSANGGNQLNGFTIQSSGTGGIGQMTVEVLSGTTVLGSASLSMGGGNSPRTASFSPSVLLVNGQSYTIRLATAVSQMGLLTSTSLGVGVTRAVADNGSPLTDVTTPFVPVLSLSLSTPTNTSLAVSSTSIGIGTNSPTAMLDVTGTTRLRTLSGAGTRMVTTDANGNLSSAPVPSSTDAQTLTTSGRNLSISNGNSVVVPAQSISRTGNVLSLTDGGTVTLPDSQTLSLTGQTLSISGGNSVTLPAAQTLIGTNGTKTEGGQVKLGGSLTENTEVYLESKKLTIRSEMPDISYVPIGTAQNGPQVNFNGITANIGNAINFTFNTGSLVRPPLAGITIYEAGTGSSGLVNLDVYDASNVLQATTSVMFTGTAGVRTLIFNQNTLIWNIPNNVLRFRLSTSVSNLGLVTSSSFGASITAAVFDNGSAPALPSFVPYGDLIFSTPTIPTLAFEGSVVGIGTDSPTNTLDVNGGVRIRTLGGSTSNMVVTNTSGVLSTAPLPSDAQTLSTSGRNLSISNGNSVLVPAQSISRSGNVLTLTDGGTVTLPDSQTLSLTGQTLSISRGNSVTLPTSPDAQTLSTSGRNLSISNGNSVVVPAQSISRTGNVLTLSDGGAVTLPDSQTLSLSGRSISISNGNSITVPAQALSKSGNTISLSDGGSITDADNQSLSISGQTLSISGANSITLPTGADNMGNHTATTNLNLNGNSIVNGGTQGISINSAGQVGINTTPGAGRLAVAGTGGIVVSTSNNGSGTTDWIASNVGAAAGDRVVSGLLFGKSTIGAHNSSLTAWSDLYVNPFGGRTGIGVETATASVDMGGSIKFRSMAGVGTRFLAADADGNLTSIASLPPANNLKPADVRFAAPASFPVSLITGGFGTYFNDGVAANGYADFLTFRTWFDNSGGNENMLVLNKNGFGMRIFQQAFGSNTAFTNYRNVMLALPNGNVGIGIDAPEARLHLTGGHMRVEGNNYIEMGGGIAKEINAGRIGYQLFTSGLDILGAGTTAANMAITMHAQGGTNFTGPITCTALTQTSDARIKHKFSELKNALDMVLAMKGHRYFFKPDSGLSQAPQIGFVAQELEQIAPELVQTNKETGLKSVNYAQVTPILVEAIKDLKAELNAAKAEISLLKADVNAAQTEQSKYVLLEKRMQAIEAALGTTATTK